MSDTDEILDVFYDDIQRMERQIINKSGIYPFIEHMDGFQSEHIWGLDEDDLDLLARCEDSEVEDGG